LGCDLNTLPLRPRLPLVCAICLILVVFSGHAAPDAPGHEDTVQNAFALLQQAGKADPAEARRLLGTVVKTLSDEKAALPAAQRRQLASEFRDRLAEAVSTPQQLETIMGKSRPAVARQVWYRRYREQRIYDTPLRLIVVVDYRKGHEPSIHSVRLPASDGSP
jgi:hypothetical protein